MLYHVSFSFRSSYSALVIQLDIWRTGIDAQAKLFHGFWIEFLKGVFQLFFACNNYHFLCDALYRWNSRSKFRQAMTNNYWKLSPSLINSAMPRIRFSHQVLRTLSHHISIPTIPTLAEKNVLRCENLFVTSWCALRRKKFFSVCINTTFNFCYVIFLWQGFIQGNNWKISVT